MKDTLELTFLDIATETFRRYDVKFTNGIPPRFLSKADEAAKARGIDSNFATRDASDILCHYKAYPDGKGILTLNALDNGAVIYSSDVPLEAAEQMVFARYAKLGEEKVVAKVLRDIRLTDEQIALYFEDSEEGRAYKAKLNETYRLDIETIMRERKRAEKKAMLDYYNDMATAREEGRAEGLAQARRERSYN